jgi:hypothetical protein
MTVTDADVEAVLPDTDITDFSPFIDAAGRLYDNLVSGRNVGTDVRDDVVTRLAAHLVATGPERQISSAGEGGGNVSFEGETEMGIDATTHGQMATTLDPTGLLASRGLPSASVSVPDVKDTGPEYTNR